MVNLIACRIFSNMKKIVFLLGLFLSACMTMQDTRQPNNKTVYQLNIGYQEAYRLISRSLLHDCDLVTNAIQPIIYTDAGYATINHVLEGVVTWSMDLKETGPAQTDMEFYTGYAVQRRYAERIAGHVNNKRPGCYYDEIN